MIVIINKVVIKKDSIMVTGKIFVWYKCKGGRKGLAVDMIDVDSIQDEAKK